MNLLISTEQNSHFSVAVGADKILKLKTIRKEYRQSELLLKTIDSLLVGEKPKAIFVVRGPGAFSSLRIGIATANALSFGWGVPVVGVMLQKGWDELTEKNRLEFVWQAGLKQRLTRSGGRKFVTPLYGAEPSITMKK